MEDFKVVKRLKAFNDLNKYTPYLLFLNILLQLLLFGDSLIQITIVNIFHNNAEAAPSIIDKRFLIRADAIVLNTCKNSDFVQGILLFFVRELAHLDFL